MGLLHEIALKALRFSRLNSGRSSPLFQELVSLVSQVTAHDCRYEPEAALFPYLFVAENAQFSPCIHTHIFENESMHMSIFGIRSGHEIPLHDHQGMFGFIKILYGSAQMFSFTPTNCVKLPTNIKPKHLFKQEISWWQKDTIFPAFCQSDILDTNSKASVVTPDENNIHIIRPVKDQQVVFFDLLTPPYLPPQHRCDYYSLLDPIDPKKVPTDFEGKKVYWLIKDYAPASYHCESVPYVGEQIDLDDYICVEH